MRHYSGRNPDAYNGAEPFCVLRRILLFLGVVYGLLAVGVHFLSLGMLFPRPPVGYELTADHARSSGPKAPGSRAPMETSIRSWLSQTEMTRVPGPNSWMTWRQAPHGVVAVLVGV